MHACSVISHSLQPYGLKPFRLLCPCDFPGKDTGAGYHFLCQEIFLTRGLNVHLLSCCTARCVLYHLSQLCIYNVFNKYENTLNEWILVYWLTCLWTYMFLVLFFRWLGYYLYLLLFSCVQLFAAPWTAAFQFFLSFTISWSSLKLMSIELVMPSNHLILCCPLLLPLQSFPAWGSFLMSQFFALGGQSFGVSASTSVLPMNTQDWSPLRWTGWISLQSKGLSRVFSNTTVQKHQFFGAQLSL